MGEIIVAGLGPGNIGLISVETLEVLTTADQLLVRTARHPTVEALSNRGISFMSYDRVYQEQSTFEAVYNTIVNDVLARSRKTDRLVYAVPGSPLVAERTVGILRDQAFERGIPLKILPGISFLDILYERLNIDPVNGITVLDASSLGDLQQAPATPLIITQVYNRQAASDTKLNLMEFYDDDHRITVARGLSLETEDIRQIPLYELDRLPVIDHLTSIYVPARAGKTTCFTIEPLVEIMAQLRSPAGCIWDIEQTHPSLRRYMVEEVYEVLEAIDEASGDKLCEELGDLLLQIVFHARIAEECGQFSMQDVIDVVTAKLIRRHPHVFGDISVRDAAEVVINWDKIKQQEKSGQRCSALDGVPKSLPSLMRAYKLQAKAAKVGFDWPSVEPVWDKVHEELAELAEAVKSGGRKAELELGDLLFAVVNLARFFDIDPEIALNMTNNKFMRRFRYIEDSLRLTEKKWEQCSLAQLDLLWEEAKVKENE